ncbi:hypothetical protein ABZ777_32255 [Micromonospora parva]|uniref:hypothetical protein n=1 Tax=Micromonospora parva TaxID=1464048 RepID=UPI0033F62D8C
MNELVRNRHLVEDLGGALRSGQHALDTVPGLLKRVLGEESWREFSTQRGEQVRHDRFVDFVTTPPLKGLGANIGLIRRLVADDTEATTLLDHALQNSDGSPGDDNSTTGRTRETAKEYALRRLSKEAPALHAEVVAGRLSANAAMIKAGYRAPTFSVRVDSPDSIAAALRRRLPPEILTQVMDRLRG